MSKTLLSMNKLKDILRRKQEWWRYNREGNQREPITSEIPQTEPWVLNTEKITKSPEREYEKYINNEYEIAEPSQSIEGKHENQELEYEALPTEVNTEQDMYDEEELLRQQNEHSSSLKPFDLEEIRKWEEKKEGSSSKPTNLQEVIEEWKEKLEQKSTPNIWEGGAEEGSSSEPTNIQEVIEEWKEKQEQKSTPDIWKEVAEEGTSSEPTNFENMEYEWERKHGKESLPNTNEGRWNEEIKQMNLNEPLTQEERGHEKLEKSTKFSNSMYPGQTVEENYNNHQYQQGQYYPNFRWNSTDRPWNNSQYDISNWNYSTQDFSSRYPGYQQNYYYYMQYRNHSFPTGQYNQTMWNNYYMNGRYPYGPNSNNNWMNINMTYFYNHQNGSGQYMNPQDQYYRYRYSQYHNQSGQFIPGYNRTYYYTLNGSIPQNQYQWYQYQNGRYPQGFNMSYYYMMNGSVPYSQGYRYNNGQYPSGYNMSYYYTLNGSIPQNQWYLYYNNQPQGYNRTYYYTINGSIPQYQYQWYQHYYRPGMGYYPYQNGSHISYVQYPIGYQYYQYNNSFPGNQSRSHIWNQSYYYTMNGSTVPYYSNEEYWNGNQYTTYNKTYRYTLNITLPMERYNFSGQEGWLNSEYFPYQNGSMVSFRDNPENSNYYYYYYRQHGYFPSQSQYRANRWNATYYYTLNGTVPQYQYYYNGSYPGINYMELYYPYENGSIVSFRDQPEGEASSYHYTYRYNATFPTGTQYSRWYTSYNGTIPQQYQYSYNISQPQYRFEYYYPYQNGSIVSYRDYPEGSIYSYQYNSSYPTGMQYHKTWSTAYYMVNGVKYYYNITQPSGSYQYQYPYQNESRENPSGSVYRYYYQYNNTYPQYQNGKWNATYSFVINGTNPTENGHLIDLFFPFRNGSMVSYNEYPTSSSYHYYYYRNGTAPYSGSHDENQRFGYESNTGNNGNSGHIRYTITPNGQTNYFVKNESYPQDQGAWSYLWYGNGSINNGNSQNQGNYGNNGYYAVNRTYTRYGSYQSESPLKSWNYTMTYKYPNEGNMGMYNRSWVSGSYSPEDYGKYDSGEYNRFNLSLSRKFNDQSWQYQHPAGNSGMWRANFTYTYKYPNGTIVTQRHSGYNGNTNFSAWNSSAQLHRLNSESFEYPAASHSRAWNISVNYGYFPNGTKYYKNGENNGGMYSQSTYNSGENNGGMYSQSIYNNGGNGVVHSYSTSNGGNGVYSYSTVNGGLNGSTYSYGTHNNGGNGGSYRYSTYSTGGNGGKYSYTTHTKDGKTVTYYSQKSASGDMSPQSVTGRYYSGGSYGGSTSGGGSYSGSSYSGSSGNMSPQFVSGGYHSGGSYDGDSGSTSTFTQGGNGKYTVHRTSIVSSQPTGKSSTYTKTYYRSGSSRVKRDEPSPAVETTKKDDISLSTVSANTTSEAVNITRVSNATKEDSAQNITSIILNGTISNSTVGNLTNMSNVTNVTNVNSLQVHKLSLIPANITSLNVSQISLNGINNTKSVSNKINSLSILNGTNGIDTARPQPLKFTLSLSVAVDTPDITDNNNSKTKK